MTDLGPGRGFPPAVYSEQAIRKYAGNKFIEALPPLTSEQDLLAEMVRVVEVADEERELSHYLRTHLVHSVPSSFMQPLTAHVLLATQVSAMIRTGYLTRNPSSPRFLRTIGFAVEAFADTSKERSDVSGVGMAVIGMSGIGKSTAIEAVLRTYPRVIWHPELEGPVRSTFQVPYLKLSCPIDGSIKTVCSNFFTQLDALLGFNYHHLHARNGTLESMRDAMATYCFMHGIGVLVIDEVQNLAKAKNGGDRVLLNFFLGLRDTLQVPVIAVGTEEAVPTLAASMQLARRHAGQPLFERMSNDHEFRRFCNALFKAYYLREPFEPTDTFRETLYDLSQGIADVVIKIFVFAQSRALAMEQESIDSDLLKLVYEESLHVLHEHLDDVRGGRQLHGPAYEASLRSTRMANPSWLKPPRQAQATGAGAKAPAGSRTGVKGNLSAGKSSRQKVVSKSSKVTEPAQHQASKLHVAVDCRKTGHSAHGALKASGFIRDLGAEIITGR